MQCPTCEENLSRADYRGLAVGRCPSCNGSWLTGGGFVQLTQMDGADASPRDVAKLKVLVGYKVDKNVSDTEHACPKCGTMLRSRNYSGIAGFKIEPCPKGCGVWVREGDLDKIRALKTLGHAEEIKTKKSAGKPAPETAETPGARPGKKKAPAKAGPAKKRTKTRKKVPPPAAPEADAEPVPPRKGFLARLLGRLLGKP